MGREGSFYTLRLGVWGHGGAGAGEGSDRSFPPQIWAWAWVCLCRKSMPNSLAGGHVGPPTLDTVGLVDQSLGDAGTRSPALGPPPPAPGRQGGGSGPPQSRPGEPAPQAPVPRPPPPPTPEPICGVQETVRSLALLDPDPTGTPSFAPVLEEGNMDPWALPQLKDTGQSWRGGYGGARKLGAPTPQSLSRQGALGREGGRVPAPVRGPPRRPPSVLLHSAGLPAPLPCCWQPGWGGGGARRPPVGAGQAAESTPCVLRAQCGRPTAACAPRPPQGLWAPGRPLPLHLLAGHPELGLPAAGR